MASGTHGLRNVEVGTGKADNTPECGSRSSETIPSCVALTGVLANRNGVWAGVCDWADNPAAYGSKSAVNASHLYAAEIRRLEKDSRRSPERVRSRMKVLSWLVERPANVKMKGKLNFTVT